MPTEMQDLALNLWVRVDGICLRKLHNPIRRGFWNRIGKPFGINAVLNSSDEELRTDLNEIYSDFREFFENKQTKDMIDEGDRLSGMDLIARLPIGKLEQVSKYF